MAYEDNSKQANCTVHTVKPKSKTAVLTTYSYKGVWATKGDHLLAHRIHKATVTNETVAEPP